MAVAGRRTPLDAARPVLVCGLLLLVDVEEEEDDEEEVVGRERVVPVRDREENIPVLVLELGLARDASLPPLRPYESDRGRSRLPLGALVLVRGRAAEAALAAFRSFTSAIAAISTLRASNLKPDVLALLDLV